MKFLTATATAALLLSTAANAATLSYSDTIATKTTYWAESILLSQFNSALGTLNSVHLTLEGVVDGTAAAESLDAAPATISLDMSANITADVVGSSLSVSVVPLSNKTFNASAFDGSIDFGGTSGTTIAPNYATDTDSSMLTSGLAGFIGTGTIQLDLVANGASSGSGAGNLITQFSTVAGATATVMYDYTIASEVPLPAGAPLLLAGLGGLALLRRRKKA